MLVPLSDILNVYNNEIKKGVKNKKSIQRFERFKIEYIWLLIRKLESNTYYPGKYNIFLVYRPKTRVIMSQRVYDKLANHYLAETILMPKLTHYLSDRNVATRKDMGTSKAMEYLIKDLNKFKNYDKFYILKIDIKKFFYSIDHEVLKSLIRNDLTDEEYTLMCRIIDSTDEEYVNEQIAKLQKVTKDTLPLYNKGKGLPIGNMTSQFLAIFYLSKLHHYIIHNLHLKHIIIYMDDYIIIHQDKEYLKKCLKIIEEKLNNEYKLELNKKKTMIVRNDIGFNFLGYNIIVKNKKIKIKLARSAKDNLIDGIKRNIYLYQNGFISFQTYFNSMETYHGSYQFVSRKEIDRIFEKYDIN